MAELTIRFDLRFGSRVLRAAGVAAIMLSAVPELGSESVTLSTYYPAPSGVYTNMITTNNTYLSRDTATNGGRTGIGTTSPSYLLHVNGTFGAGQSYLTNSDIYFTGTGHSHSGIGNTPGYAAIENAQNYNTLMILGRSNGIGGVRSVSMWDRLDVNGSTYANGQLSVSGDTYLTNRVQISGQGSFIAPKNDCSIVGFTAGLTTCPGGTYVTLQSGLMSKYAVVSNGVDPNGDMLCCPCPSGGCPGM